MTSFEALILFKDQLQRNITSGKFKTKIVITPSSVDEKGVIIKLSMLKPVVQLLPAAKPSRIIRVRIRVSGSAESLTGLTQACDMIDALNDYLIRRKDKSIPVPGKAAAGELRLEDDTGIPVPCSRIVITQNQEDSFIDSPDSTAVQDVEDDRIAVIYFPWEV
jgi:hypothetical protein